MNYRRIKKKDTSEIRNLALKSWRFTYQAIYKDKTIQKMVYDYYSDKNFQRTFDDIEKGKAEFIVATESHKIVGYAHVCNGKQKWEVMRIYVNPKLLRRGIGSGLILRIERFLKKKRAKSYIIHPHIKNKIAINFYKKAGFLREPKLDRGWHSPSFKKYL